MNQAKEVPHAEAVALLVLGHLIRKRVRRPLKPPAHRALQGEPRNVFEGALRNVLTMRSLADADALAPLLVGGARVLVVGGGYVGLEAAAVAASKGLQVTLLEAAPRILQRVAAAPTAAWLRALHQRHGVLIREGTALRRLLAGGERVCGAELADGSRIAADLVLVGIGAEPEVELARQAGLAIDDGIAVDAFCRTSDEAILAAGDCCSFEFDGRRLRLESVHNANEQAAAAALSVAGQPRAYAPLPWFWSDQYDCKLQIAGLNVGHDDVVLRRGSSARSQSAWYFRGERLLAVDAINDAAAFVMARKLLEHGGGGVPKAAVADPASDPMGWLQ